MPEKPIRNDKREEGAELESQFILRLPEDAANNLKEAVRSGANLKEKLSISLENDDLRKGMVRLDDQYFYAKIVDIPCVVESLKTIDKKSFYKTADICQMMICKEQPDPVTDDEKRDAQKNKKKDPNKIDKKYLYPHGLTPSLKNVRKRRFRKTLKKKNVELPEIEKEVKRLLRVDNEAVSVKWEIVECEDQQISESDVPKKGEKQKGRGSKQVKEIPVDERRIFGEELSDSEEDEETVRDVDVEETRLSEDSRSRFSDSNSMQLHNQSLTQSHHLPTEFDKDMFGEPSTSSFNMSQYEESLDSKQSTVNERIGELKRELNEIRQNQARVEQEIQTIDNKKLKERMQEDLYKYMNDIEIKEMELDDLMNAAH